MEMKSPKIGQDVVELFNNDGIGIAMVGEDTGYVVNIVVLSNHDLFKHVKAASKRDRIKGAINVCFYVMDALRKAVK